MKTKILLIVCSISLLGFGQNTKMETFLTGTKVLFYPNKCGVTIPEAQGKLTFCDRANNLGVVERNYGLNYRGVLRMLSNHYNQDEVYVTKQGLSIRNTDGIWDNVPNMAIPLWGTQYIPSIQNGMVQSDGKIILFASNSGAKMHIYNRVQKTISSVDFPNSKYPANILYDSDHNLTWILAYGGGLNGTYLFSYDGNTLVEVAKLTGIQASSVPDTPFIYHNNQLFLGGNKGLFKIDISNTSAITVTKYDSTTTPSLPFDWVNDLQFDTNGMLWMAQGNNNDGAIVNFNIVNQTYDMYQLARPGNASINQKFQNLAIDNNGVIWASSYNYSGLAKLTFVGTTPHWENIPKTDLTTLGVPITYNPNNIYFRNNKFYFTTNDGSSSNNNSYEVIINDNGNWSGRNDNASGNLSQWMNSRFTKSLADDKGGVWWFNRYDNIVVYRDKDDNHKSIALNIGHAAAIDSDNKAIVKGGNPSEIRKIDFPNAVSIQNGLNGATDMQRVGNQIWIFDHSRKKIDIYENNALVTTYNLDGTDHSGYYHFAVDDESNVWFAKLIGQTLRLKKFDTATLTSTTVEIAANIRLFTKILAAPNNAIWVVGQKGAVYYQNGNHYSFLDVDYTEIYNVWDATVDSNGKLCLLNNDLASITTLENPTAATPTLTNTVIEGNNSILPSFRNYRPGTITIDSEGSIWTHTSQHAIKLVDNDFSTEYRRQSTLAVPQQILISDILIYPNPVHNLLNIISKHPIEKVELFSLLGKKILETKNINYIHLEHLKRGVYIVKIRSNNSFISKRLMIN